jgi:penicillin-binding protein 1A
MLSGYTMFPSGGLNTQPYFIAQIEDKNGNVLARFNSTPKEVLNQVTAYTMVRMLQGPVDFGTAKGLRERLGLAEMGGKTGTTNDNSDCWFIGFTPQLLAGGWVGCDDRFIRLESRSADGGHVTRPIWEAFFAKALADRSLGLRRDLHFTKPDSLSLNAEPDWRNLESLKAPGAEGVDQGNGDADAYGGVPDTTKPKAKASNPY